jgi:hypothetical protein
MSRSRAGIYACLAIFAAVGLAAACKPEVVTESEKPVPTSDDDGGGGSGQPPVVMCDSSSPISGGPAGTCLAGNKPTIFTLSPSASQIVSDGTSIFWGATGGVFTCPRDNCCNPTKLVGTTQVTQPAPPIAIDATYVYYFSSVRPDGGGGSQIYRCAKTGCGGVGDVVGPAGIEPVIGLDDDHVYWENAPLGSNGVVMSANKDGSNLHPVPGVPHVWLVAAGNLYWNDANDPEFNTAKILACPVSGCVGAPTVIVASPDQIGSIIADGNDILWIEVEPDQKTEGIYRCPLSGCVGSPEIIAANQVASSLAADDCGIYWSGYSNLPSPFDAGVGGIVSVCAKPSCNSAPTNIVLGSGALPGPIALDARDIFWTEVEFGTVGQIVR